MNLKNEYLTTDNLPEIVEKNKQNITGFDGDISQIQQDLTTVENDVITAQRTADRAETKADTAQTTADNAQRTANSALTGPGSSLPTRAIIKSDGSTIKLEEADFSDGNGGFSGTVQGPDNQLISKGYVDGITKDGNVAIGAGAGEITQGDFGVAIGLSAGQTNQGNNAIAIGYKAGNLDQSPATIHFNSSSLAQPNPPTGGIRFDSGLVEFTIHGDKITHNGNQVLIRQEIDIPVANFGSTSLTSYEEIIIEYTAPAPGSIGMRTAYLKKASIWNGILRFVAPLTLGGGYGLSGVKGLTIDSGPASSIIQEFDSVGNTKDISSSLTKVIGVKYV